MRVNLVCGSELCSDMIVKTTYDMLVDQLCRLQEVTLTAEHPDVVHVLGAWSAAAITSATSATKRHIPLIYTPLGALAPWHKPTASHQRRAATAQALIASGVLEQRLLSKEDSIPQLILNAVTTKTTTPTAMAYAYIALYDRHIKHYEEQRREEIEAKVRLLNEDDQQIVALCRTLLYAQYLYERHNIPKPFLRQLTALLTTSDFDEDHFADVAKLISLYDFTRRIEYVMREQTGLTEGFMPLPMSSDKAARAMLSAVTDYDN